MQMHNKIIFNNLIKYGNYDSVALRAIDKLASLEIERDGGRPISEYFISSLLTLSKESQYKKHVVKHLMHLFVSLQKTTIEDLFKCVDYKLPGDVMDILHLEILSRAQYSWHYCAVASTTGNSKIAEDAFSKFLDNIIHLTSRIANSSCAGTQKKAKAILDLLGQKV